MRTVFLLLILVTPWALQAQGTGALAKMDKLASQAARVKTHAPKAVLSVRIPPILPPATVQRWTHLEKVILRNIEPTVNARVANYAQRTEARQQYASVMEEFLKFKKDADAFLYYRAQQAHPTALTPVEKRLWLERIDVAERQLNTLRGVIRAEDAAIQRAHAYLNEVLLEISPGLKPFKVPQIHFKRTDRVYKPREFFLHEPIAPIRLAKKVHRFFSAHPKRPENLQIAIFNDCSFFIDDFVQWYKQGSLFNNHRMVFFTKAQEPLRYIQQVRMNQALDTYFYYRNLNG